MIRYFFGHFYVLPFTIFKKNILDDLYIFLAKKSQMKTSENKATKLT